MNRSKNTLEDTFLFGKWMTNNDSSSIMVDPEATQKIPLIKETEIELNGEFMRTPSPDQNRNSAKNEDQFKGGTPTKNEDQFKGENPVKDRNPAEDENQDKDKNLAKGMTEMVFILDRSGSMSGLEKDTIGGFNSMLKKQKELDGNCRITTVLFDHDYELLHDRIDIQAVKPMTDKEYYVGGLTALMDAIGITVNKLISVQKNTAKEYRADKVIFVIITDGEENSSKEYSTDTIRKMIEQEQKDYGWEFIFLGANIDAVETAGRFGIKADRAVDYVPDEKGTELNFSAMSETVACFRQTGHVPAAPMQAIREDMNKRGKKRSIQSRRK